MLEPGPLWAPCCDEGRRRRFRRRDGRRHRWRSRRGGEPSGNLMPDLLRFGLRFTTEARSPGLVRGRLPCRRQCGLQAVTYSHFKGNEYGYDHENEDKPDAPGALPAADRPVMASALWPLVMGMKRKVVIVTVRHTLSDRVPLTWPELTGASGLVTSPLREGARNRERGGIPCPRMPTFQWFSRQWRNPDCRHRAVHPAETSGHRRTSLLVNRLFPPIPCLMPVLEIQPVRPEYHAGRVPCFPNGSIPASLALMGVR